MKASKVLEKIQRMKPNALNDDDLLDILNELEQDIAINVLHIPYVPITHDNKYEELLAVTPYEKLYFTFAGAQIDKLNGDMELYSMSSNQFNVDYNDYKGFCIRNGLTPGYTARAIDYF